MQIFFFKIYINSKAAELSCENQGVNGVATETGYALGYDGIDFPGSAILDQSQEICAVPSACARGAPVGIYVHQLSIIVSLYQLCIVADLGCKAVALFLGLCRNTAVCCHAPFRRALLRLCPWKYHRQVSLSV